MTPRVFEIAELAQLLNAKLHGPQCGTIHGVAPIALAQKGHLTFFVGGVYRKYLTLTQASAVIMVEQDLSFCPEELTALVVRNPEVVFAEAVRLFYPMERPENGIHSSAVIGNHCQIDKTASIGAHCTIEDGVVIGPRTTIMPGTVVGKGSVIGEDCVLYRNVTIYHQIVIGNHVIIHAGAVIGADGFGFAEEQGQWIKIPQIGRVVIENDVEIGANTTIDRGALSDTIIHKGVKIDNQVQVAHNVEIGEHTIIAGCVGIAGSVKIGKHCMIGGACNISGHLTIADNVILTGTASVISSIDQAGVYSSGINARPHREWVRTVVRFGHLDEMGKRITQLEKLCNEHDE